MNYTGRFPYIIPKGSVLCDLCGVIQSCPRMGGSYDRLQCGVIFLFTEQWRVNYIEQSCVSSVGVGSLDAQRLFSPYCPTAPTQSSVENLAADTLQVNGCPPEGFFTTRSSHSLSRRAVSWVGVTRWPSVRGPQGNSCQGEKDFSLKKSTVSAWVPLVRCFKASGHTVQVTRDVACHPPIAGSGVAGKQAKFFVKYNRRKLFNPFTPKSDHCQISPAASHQKCHITQYEELRLS